MTDHERFGELAGAYALGALSLDERRAFESHLATCAECLQELRDATLVAEGLGRAVAPQEPSAGLRARVLAAAVAAPRAELPRTTPPVVAPPRPIAQWLAMAASFVALALGVYAWTLHARLKEADAALRDARGQLVMLRGQVADLDRVSRDTTLATDVLDAPDVVRVDLAGQNAAQQASGRAFWSPSRGLVFTANRLPPLPAGQVYQLWVVTGSGPVSAGLTRPDSAGRARSVTQPTTSLPVKAIAVTVSPEGGLSAPIGDMYLVGSL